jgi:TRAP-type C4-dicarboxylate transport system substrate-binding protein
MVRSIAAPLAALLLLAASPSHAAKRVIHWYLGHPNLDYFEEAAIDFKKAVEARSHGELEVRIVVAYDEDALAAPKQDADIAGKVSRGEVEMGHSFTDVMGAVDPRLHAFEAPYLFRGYRHLEGVFEGPLGAQLLADLGKKNLTGLCFTYSGGASGVAAIDREIRKPEDLKGLKVGVYGDAVEEAWLTSLGASPVRISHELSAIDGMAASGRLDAVAITWRNFQRTALNERFKHFSLPGSTYLVSMTYANKAFFESLTPEQQAIIREESLRSARVERAKTIQLNEQARREMLAKGTLAVHLSEPAKAAFEKALRPAYAKTIEGVLGRELIKTIRKTPDAAQSPVVDQAAVASY